MRRMRLQPLAVSFMQCCARRAGSERPGVPTIILMPTCFLLPPVNSAATPAEPNANGLKVQHYALPGSVPDARLV
ncbi:unnamed protein product [Arctogadus glacialis]